MKFNDKEEYQLRRNHENELYRQHNSLERGRAERVVYFAGLIPLTTLSLAELQWMPGVLLVVSIIMSILAYGHWYVNEYHGACWRIYDARRSAHLADPQNLSIGDDDKTAAQYGREVKRHSRLADRTARTVIAHLLMSFGITAFALLDQYLDLEFLPTPSQFEVALAVSILIPVFVLWLIVELLLMLKEGWPTTES